MCKERFRILAEVIAAHPARTAKGRTRLQKTIMLLQSLGLETDYSYMLHFYGPYSEGLQAEVGLLEQLGFISEKAELLEEGRLFYTIEADPSLNCEEISEKYGEHIKLMSKAKFEHLELAATYQAFIESGFDSDKSLEMVKYKKPRSATEENLKGAMELLEKLELRKAA